MPNEQLAAHIRSELARGVDKTALIKSLLAVGWKMEDINVAIANVEPVPSQSMPVLVKYAGLFLRAAAVLIDGIVLSIVNIPIYLFLGKGLLGSALSSVIGLIYIILMVFVYQATLGKIAVGLHIQRVSGEKIGFLRTVLREIIGKFLSTITLFIGYLMVGWTQKKQGLHDKIADTVVVENDPTKSKTVWKIIGGVFGLLLPVVFVLGVLSAVVLASLNSARMKGSDATVRSHMSTVAVQAELYYDTVYEGYLGYCTSPEALAALADASRSGSTDESDTFYICNDTKEAYAASAPLKSGGYVCVDSMGASASAVVEDLLPIGSYSCSLTSGNLLSGSNKDDFIRESINGCIESAVNNPSYDGISSPSISSYCSCVSNKIADETTNEEIKEIADLSEDAPLPSYMQERVDAANDVCGVLLEQ